MRKDADRGVGCQPRLDSIRATGLGKRERVAELLPPSFSHGGRRTRRGGRSRKEQQETYRGSNLASLKTARACIVRFPRQVLSTLRELSELGSGVRPEEREKRRRDNNLVRSLRSVVCSSASLCREHLFSDYSASDRVPSCFREETLDIVPLG